MKKLLSQYPALQSKKMVWFMAIKFITTQNLTQCLASGYKSSRHGATET